MVNETCRWNIYSLPTNVDVDALSPLSLRLGAQIARSAYFSGLRVGGTDPNAGGSVVDPHLPRTS